MPRSATVHVDLIHDNQGRSAVFPQCTVFTNGQRERRRNSTGTNRPVTGTLCVRRGIKTLKTAKHQTDKHTHRYRRTEEQTRRERKKERCKRRGREADVQNHDVANVRRCMFGCWEWRLRCRRTARSTGRGSDSSDVTHHSIDTC